MSLGIPELALILIVVLFFVALVMIPYWRIFKKAGFNPALSLLMLVPLANVIMLYFLAFADWPVLRKKEGQ